MESEEFEKVYMCEHAQKLYIPILYCVPSEEKIWWNGVLLVSRAYQLIPTCD
jgi:hypothetical protein